MKHKANTIRYNISYKVKSKSRKYNIEEKKRFSIERNKMYSKYNVH